MTMDDSMEDISSELESVNLSINGFGVDDNVRTVLIQVAGAMESLPGLGAPGYQRVIELTINKEELAIKQLAIKYGHLISLGPEARIALHFMKVLAECRRLARDPAWIAMTQEQKDATVRGEEVVVSPEPEGMH